MHPRTEVIQSGKVRNLDVTEGLTYQGTPFVPSAVTDEKAKVSSNDTTAGYLNGKLVAGTNITLTENNNGGNETLTISAAGGGGGLVGFTGSQNSTGVNITVNASRLLADATSVNADIVLQPKGQGAVLAQLPDGTTTGGNKRNSYSVDLQTVRNNAADVASGGYSVVVGGNSNRSSGSYASILGGSGNQAQNTHSVVVAGLNNISNNNYATVVGGQASTASGQHSFIGGGQSNTTSGSHTVVAGGFTNSTTAGYSFVGGGYTNTATGQYSSVLAGQNNSAAGVNSAIVGSSNSVTTNSGIAVGTGNNLTQSGSDRAIALGSYNTIDDGYECITIGRSNNIQYGYRGVAIGRNNVFVNSYDTAIALGIEAAVRSDAHIAHSQGKFSVAGDCQQQLHIVRAETVGNETVFTGQVATQTFSYCAFEALVVARATNNSGNYAAWKISGSYYTAVEIGSIFIGTPTVVSLGSSFSPTNPSVTPYVANDNLQFQVTGVTGMNIRWGVSVNVMVVMGL